MHSNKKARAESFTRLVELGGGKVVKAEPPYTDAKGATHCMYEKVPNVGVDFKVKNTPVSSLTLKTTFISWAMHSLQAQGQCS